MLLGSDFDLMGDAAYIHATTLRETEDRSTRICPGCESLWVIHLYTGIARRKGESGDG